MIEGLPVDVSVRGTVVERVQLTGPACFKWIALSTLTEQGFRVIRNTPKPVEMGQKDETTFFIVAEREKPL
jgi:uncharacterized protein with GYD domain